MKKTYRCGVLLRLILLSLCLACVIVLSGCHTAESPAPVEETKANVMEEHAEPEPIRIEDAGESNESPQGEASPDIEPLPEPEDTDFVKVRDYIPDILVDLRYATDNNFTGKVIYDFTDAYLRYGTVKKLLNAQETLKSEGYCLKIWDALRPVAAQYKLFEAYPVDAYVADPSKHYSSHNRGNTVDITMVALDGELVEMPTDFDDFSAKADRDYSDCTAEARKNAELLESVMRECGFKPYSAEWWHFVDRDDYDVDPEFYPEK